MGSQLRRIAGEEDSIPSAISIPPMQSCRSLDDVEGVLLEEQRYLFSSKKRKLRDVVLFGDAAKKSSADDAGEAKKTCSWLRTGSRSSVGHATSAASSLATSDAAFLSLLLLLRLRSRRSRSPPFFLQITASISIVVIQCSYLNLRGALVANS
ncbi:hypothetical protein PR001_g2345 [Phytophthora rubi]|uniref:Uncharacterized protein n=1 Tax=Phytophthora rubi TaxID=129364 RepID=A0A6A3NY41_9STRA|nr:hypothetical protein PR001_g2345 [Phytophthora rubi]